MMVCASRLTRGSATLLRMLDRTVCLIALLFCASARAEEEAHQALTFEKDIRPILRAHCLDCHGGTDDLKGGLDLRQVRRMLAGGDSGPAIRIGQPEESLLMVRITSGEMPPGEAKLTPQEREILEGWLQEGAKTARPEPETIAAGVGIMPEERAFWSFQPIVRPPEPVLKPERAIRVRTPIDAFLLARMPEGLMFAADADRHTLILRAHFDLTGLPPNGEMLQQWLNDPSDDWYSRMIEALLANPSYGERWARHWLDVAGYADSDGFTVSDPERPWAWKYRDYVVRSFNADKPFDRFIHEQIAGDELAGPQNGDLTVEQIELLAATGFLRTAADGTGSGEDHPTGRNQVIGDTLKIVGTSMLGLSIGCAQCHDHRYDPIPQADYFALRAVFAPAMDWQNWRVPSQRLVSLYTDADRKKSAEVSAEAARIGEERSAKEKEYMARALEKELQKYEEPLRVLLKSAYETPADQRSPEQHELLKKYPSVNISPGVLYQYLPDAAEDLKKYDARIAEVHAKRPPEEFLAVLNEPAGHLPETRLFHRGDFQQPRDVITPAALTAVCPEDQRVEFAIDDPNLPTSGRRLAFAKWLTDRSNPLVARVIVNRIWMHHFGKGIVATPSDFGRLGVAPSHPELLDWLADEFAQNGWSLKHLHRLILSSTAWRQSSRREPMHETLDPDNMLYSRQSIRRLDAEIIRDRMLASAGRLSPQQSGSPAPLREDDAGQVLIDDSETRRSLYIKVRRTQPVAMLQAFDSPVMEVNCERRPVSTVATQSLMLMNSLSVIHHASKLAEKARADAAAIPENQLTALPQLPALPTDIWQYGYGSGNDATQQVDQFTKLKHFSGSSWQAGPSLPDANLGYVLLRADGGHPDQPGRDVIRRWVAPKSGSVAVTGKLAHGSENGDGVRGRILTNRPAAGGSQLLLEQVSFNNSTDTAVSGVVIEAGESIDFIVDCRTSHTSDSFQWTVQIHLAAADGSSHLYDSAAGFRGPSDPPGLIAGQIQAAWKLAYSRLPDADELSAAMSFLSEQINYLQHNKDRIPEGLTETQQAMVNLCQALITSNEFLYVK